MKCLKIKKAFIIFNNHDIIILNNVTVLINNNVNVEANMELKNYQDLIEKVQKTDSKKRVAVAAAHDEHTLEAVFRAVDDKLVEPVLSSSARREKS